MLTWNQICGTIAERLGVEADNVHVPSDFIEGVAPELSGSLLGNKTWSVVIDNSKIGSSVPGFRSEIAFTEGIRRTLAWFDGDASRRGVDDEANDQVDGMFEAYTGAPS